jgi:hypothetical protein
MQQHLAQKTPGIAQSRRVGINSGVFLAFVLEDLQTIQQPKYYAFVMTSICKQCSSDVDAIHEAPFLQFLSLFYLLIMCHFLCGGEERKMALSMPSKYRGSLDTLNFTGHDVWHHLNKILLTLTVRLSLEDVGWDLWP